MNKKYRDYNHQWVDVILNYFGKKCTYCNKRTDLEIHHKIPLYLGGANRLENLEIVCTNCHTELHRQLRKIFKKQKTRDNDEFEKINRFVKNQQIEE